MLLQAELEELIELCDNEGYIIKIVRECRELLDKIVDVDDALEAAIAKFDEMILTKALEMAAEFGYTQQFTASPTCCWPSRAWLGLWVSVVCCTNVMFWYLCCWPSGP